MWRSRLSPYGFWLIFWGICGAGIGTLAWRPPDRFWTLWALPVLWRLAADYPHGTTCSGVTTCSGATTRHNASARRPWWFRPRILTVFAYYTAALLPSAWTLRAYWPSLNLAAAVAIVLALPLLLSLPWLWAARHGASARRGTSARNRISAFCETPAHRPASAGRYAVALALTALPPLGAIGMASPLFAAAPAFPGFGLAGLLLTTAGLTVLATGSRRLLLPAVPLLALLSLVAHTYSPTSPRPPAQIHTVSTRLGRGPTNLPLWLNRNLALRTLVHHALHHTPTGSVLLFPEDIAGPWTHWSSVFWGNTSALARARYDTVLLGATLAAPHGGLLDALIGFGAHPTVVSARQPIPLASWLPARRNSYRTDWLRFGPATIAGHRVAVLVCYEQLLIWPTVWAFLSPHPPNLIIAISNHGWATDGLQEPQIQANAAAALARIFGVPKVSATNAPRPAVGDLHFH